MGLLGTNIPTILSDKLYLAAPQEMLAQIQATDPAVHTLLLVCHNPGAHALLGMLVDSYADEADADRMMLKFPTAACAVMSLGTKAWHDVAAHSAHLEKLRY